MSNERPKSSTRLKFEAKKAAKKQARLDRNKTDNPLVDGTNVVYIDGLKLRIGGTTDQMVRDLAVRVGELLTNGTMRMDGDTVEEVIQRYASSTAGVTFAIYLRVRHQYRFLSGQTLTEGMVWRALLLLPNFRARVEQELAADERDRQAD